MIARNVMKTDVVCVRGTDTARRAGEIMLETGYAALPVVDDNGRLLGVFGEFDLLALTVPEYLSSIADLSFLPKSSAFPMPGTRNLDEVLVGTVLRAQSARTVPADEPVLEIARMMVRDNVRRCLVVEGDRLVGLIARRDLMEFIVRPSLRQNGGEPA